MSRDLEYEANNMGVDENVGEEGIKCKNFVVCGTTLPIWWFECKGQYLCTGCHMSFGSWGSGEHIHVGKGELSFSSSKEECCICLEIAPAVSQPRCDHYVCVSCFKRCHYGEPRVEIPFPYPEMEEEYFEDQDNPKWETDYPLIEPYNQLCSQMEDEREERFAEEEHLRQCPICRK